MDRLIQLKDGRKISYAEYGYQKGKPIFFLHGWPSCRFHAERFAEAAHKLKIRLIAPDRPGIGLSTFQQRRSLLDYPNDIVELASQLKIKNLSIVGVSGGGPYAAACAYSIPSRLTKVGIVVGLSPTNVPGIFSGMTLGSRLGWQYYAKIPGLKTLSAFTMFMIAKYFTFLSPMLYRAKSDKLIMDNSFKLLTKKTNRETWRQGLHGPIKDLELYTSDWGFDLSEITTKVYLWYGPADKNVSLNMGKYYAKHIPNSKLTIYPGEGHLCQITHAEEILKMLVM